MYELLSPVVEILTEQTFFAIARQLDDMGENNTHTAFISCGSKSVKYT